MKDRIKIILFTLVFLAAYFVPFNTIKIHPSIDEAFLLLQDYARHHILLCLVPAFFIAGGIKVFISQGVVIKYFGAGARKWISYSIASVSGSILAVCSCTVLPLFAGIYTRGAGLGPAIAFLYSGPAINVLAIILTAKILGAELGIARAIGAILFSVIIGIIMHLIFLNEERKKAQQTKDFAIPDDDSSFSLQHNVLFFAVLIGVLVFVNLGKTDESIGFWNIIYSIKWYISGILLITLLILLYSWFSKAMLKNWIDQAWFFAKQILPLLFAGILIAGLLLGRPEHPALIPKSWIAQLVGGNSLFANFFSSIAGAFMYFATLTEVPILQGLIGNGMGKGPALALLLAGPALSLPNMLVIRSVIGTWKTILFVSLVVVMATFTGLIYGTYF